MRLWSDAWHDGDPLPLRFASGHGRLDGTRVAGDNLNPPLRWADLPAGCRSLALLCHDFDATAPAACLGALDAAAVAALARCDFYHWVLVDLPASTPGLAEGQWRRGFRPGGHAAASPGPAAGPREGLNDFGRWYAGQAGLAGQYSGYDGPCLSPLDPLVHHLLFTLYALDSARLALPWPFTGPMALRAMAGHVLGCATLSATCAAVPAMPPQWPAPAWRRQQQAQDA